MTWKWNHVPEAYTTLRARIARLPREELETIYAEWKASPRGFFPNADYRATVSLTGDLDDRRYARALSAASYLSTDELAERIYDWAERQCKDQGIAFESRAVDVARRKDLLS